MPRLLGNVPRSLRDFLMLAWLAVPASDKFEAPIRRPLASTLVLLKRATVTTTKQPPAHARHLPYLFQIRQIHNHLGHLPIRNLSQQLHILVLAPSLP